MKPLFRIFFLMLIACSAKGQYLTVTNLSGTALYGSTNVTVTSAGSASSTPYCGVNPYWIGAGSGPTIPVPGSYTFTFSSPVSAVRVYVTAMDVDIAVADTEKISISINGVFYPMTLANLTTYAGTCGQPPATIMSGWLTAVIDLGFGTGALLDVSAGTINSCTVATNGLDNGSTFTFQFMTGPTNNGPICIGDTLKLFWNGDSTGTTYSWTGPGGFTSTLQNPFRYPTTFADSGWYQVVRIKGGLIDSGRTHVDIMPKPVMNVSTNAPLCIGALATLELYLGPGGVGDTYSWTGPAGFTSALQNPTKPGYTPADVGTYTVIETTPFGCKDTASIYAGIVPPPPPPVITGDTNYCYGETFVPFSVTGIGTINWYATSTSTTGTTTAPVVNTSVSGFFTYYARQVIGSCESPVDSITVHVYPQIVPNFTYTVDFDCTSDAVAFVNNTTGAVRWEWAFGDESLHDFNFAPPVHTYTTQGKHPVRLTVHNELGCEATFNADVDTRHNVIPEFGRSQDTFCINPLMPITFTDLSTTNVYTTPGVPVPGQIIDWKWYMGDGSMENTQVPLAHTYATAGTYVVTLVVTDSIGCKDSITHAIYALRIDIKGMSDSTLCLKLPLPLRNVVSVFPMVTDKFTYTWTESSPNLDNLNIQIPSLTGFGDFTDTLTVTLPWGCFARDTITVHSVKGAVLSNVTADATIKYGNSIQLNAGNEIYYYWMPNDGSLSNPNINNPVATPLQSTIYTVYGYDKNGCMDSAFVNVTVDDKMNEGIPTAFTPNHDGLNDVFRPAIRFQKMVDFSVYNRWGQQVFQTNDRDHGWDGTFQNTPLDMGVYYYMIIVARPGGENVIYKGEVTLIR